MAEPPLVADAILLQAFHWESCFPDARVPEAAEQSWYARLTTQVDEMADIGIDSVWLPPPSVRCVCVWVHASSEREKKNGLFWMDWAD
jgi:hypothetical protein